VNARRFLLECFDAALRRVDGRTCVRNVLSMQGPGPFTIFAIGKAASAMALGAHDSLGERIDRALVITKDGHADPDLARIPGITLLEAAHPVPDGRSLAAGAELERHIAALAPSSTPVFLVSGGSSSLVESLREGVTLTDLRELNARGLASGWDIARLNAERAELSRLKAGGVARLLGGRPARALFVSDVPDDDPEVIGSGLLGRGDDRDRVERGIVASVESAVEAAVDAAFDRGVRLEELPLRFDGDAERVARDFVRALRETAADGVIWGGESTVTLPARPGRGGRNTHLALAAARQIRREESLAILAGATDGTDGPTNDAGAIVDAGTLERAELGGCDVDRALRDFDSGTALEAAEDLIHTGPTGTNVGDLLIGIKRPGRRRRDLATPRVV
jgi:glycerate 2-kinase